MVNLLPSTETVGCPLGAYSLVTLTRSYRGVSGAPVVGDGLNCNRAKYPDWDTEELEILKVETHMSIIRVFA
jgi:hypothetical protein